MDIEAIKLIAAAFALLPIIAVANALGKIFTSYNESAARNPTACEFMDKKYFLAFAFTEALAIFALGVSLLILLS